MADDKPPFDPTQPFEPVGESGGKPAFDPSKPFEAGSPTSAWDAVTDIPSEIGKEAAAGASDVAGLASRGEVGKDEGFFSPNAAAEGLMTVPKAVLGAVRTVASPITGTARSVLGHGLAGAERFVGENVVNPVMEHFGYQAQHPDPEQMYETAKGDVDTAISAVRPAGAPVKLPGLTGGKPAYEWNAPPQTPKPIGRAKQPDTEAFFDSSTQHYSNMRGFGVEIKPHAMNGVADNIINELYAEGYRPRNSKVFDDVNELRSPAGVNHEISDIDSVRKVLRRTSVDPSERDAARIAIKHIDDYLVDLKNNPQDIAVNPQFAQQVSDEALAARGDWAVANRSEDIDEAISNARLQAGGTYSGQNFNNALRQQLKALRRNKKKMLGWNDDEKAELESVITGSWSGNRARELGKFAPHGVVPTTAAMLAGRMVAPGIGEVAVPAAGWIARKIGDRITKAATQRLSEVVKGRSPLGRQTAINAAAQSALAPPTVKPGIFATGIAANAQQRRLPAINIRPLNEETADADQSLTRFKKGGLVVYRKLRSR